MAEFLKVAETQDILAGQGKKVNVGGKHIALFNVDGNYYAIDDTCTHKGGPLSQGEVHGTKGTSYSQKSRALWMNSKNLIGKVSGTLLIEAGDNPRPVSEMR